MECNNYYPFVNLTYLVIHYVYISSIIHILYIWQIVVNISLDFSISYVWNHRDDYWRVWKYHYICEMSTFDLHILSIMDFVVVLTLSNKQGESSLYICRKTTHQCRASEESTQRCPMETLSPLPSMQHVDLCSKSHEDCSTARK